MQYVSFANPRYSTPDNLFVDVDIVLSDGAGSVPYTCCAADPVSADLFAAVKKAGRITAYSAPALDPSDAAQAVLAGGLALTSAGSPALDGTYGCDQLTQQRIMAETISLLQNGTFADGSSIVRWPDMGGDLHEFSVAQFKQFNTKIAGFVAGCIAVITTNTGTPPAAAAAID